MYKIIPKEDYIAHHGITGQRWGKRNGPPYPLKKSIKKIKRKIRKAKKHQVDTRPRPSDIRKMSDAEIEARTVRFKKEAELYKASRYGESEVEKVFKESVSSGVKKGAGMLIGAGIAATGAYIIAKKTGLDVNKADIGKKVWDLMKPKK